MKSFLLKSICLAIGIVNTVIMSSQVVNSDSITDKVICGYQGWFSCFGDGSPVERWFHWSNGNYRSNIGEPAAGNLRVDIYPDVSGYNPSGLFQTGFANLGNGQPSKLFSSYIPSVIDTQFSWLKKNNIDGVALQRFIGETDDPLFKLNRDSISVRIKGSAEKYNRLFYLMYCGFAENEFDSIKNDWQNNMLAKLHITSSSMYAKQDSKPVVCLWGFGLDGLPGDATHCLDVINWFKAHGCYVIGGVATNWRTCTGDSKPGFENVYKAFDMISPWTVGRYTDSTGIDNFKNNYLIPDMSYCHTYGMRYQPVIFPGFSWANWNGGPPNEIPRNKGNFMWRQVYNLKQLGVKNIYVAMFDEYDEGTAIANMADSYFEIPTNQWFVTSSADGSYISSDFYLRLVGKASNIIKGKDALTPYVNIPNSVGPVWFRTSFEKNYDAMPTWNDSIENNTIQNVSGYQGQGKPLCSVVREKANTGYYALRYSGSDLSATMSHCYFRVIKVNIPVQTDTKLTFWTLPETAISRFVTIDLIMTDGSSLRDCGATDANSQSMHPGQGRGVVNKWTQTSCNIGQWLNGKTIDRILVAFDHVGDIGDFKGYIDDICIYSGNINPFYLPETACKIIGKAAICKGQTNVSYTVPSINSALSYIWTLPGGIIDTTILNNVSVNFTNNSNDDIIKVKGHNQFGDGQESSILVTVNDIPSKPVVIQNNNSLQSNANYGNQWYYNGSIISGANSSTYVPIKEGEYYSIVTLNECSSGPSNTISFIFTGILNEKSSDQYFKVFPNPAKNHFRIEFNKPQLQDKVIKLLTTTGVLIETFNIIANQSFVEIYLCGYNDGVYLLSIEQDGSVLHEKIVIEK